MLPFTVPVAVGLNVIAKTTFCVGLNVTGALPPVIEYPAPLSAICEIVTLEFPVFVIVTPWAADDVPVVTFPKLKVPGPIPSVSVGAMPAPARLTEFGEVGALLKMDTLPEVAPVVVGKNATVIEV